MGEVTAFVSHSWSDPGDAKFDQLQDFAMHVRGSAARLTPPTAELLSPTPTQPIVLAQPRPRRASALKPRDEASRTKRSEKENVSFQLHGKAAETSNHDAPKRRVLGDARGQ